jgi:hypothetical protein
VKSLDLTAAFRSQPGPDPLLFKTATQFNEYSRKSAAYKVRDRVHAKSLGEFRAKTERPVSDYPSF